MDRFNRLILCGIFAVLPCGALVSCSSTDNRTDSGTVDSGSDLSADGGNDSVIDGIVPDEGRPDAMSDSAADFLSDSTPDVGDSSDDGLESDGSDAVADSDDGGPKVPWYEQLSPGGQKVRDIFGVASHMDANVGENPQREFEFAKYAELGGVRMRRGLRWNRVEPVQGEWHFEQASAAVDGAAAANVKILPMLCYGVKWALADGETYGSVDINAFANYAGEMAREFCDQTKEYEIWNEQNITRFWDPAPDPAKYADMLALSAIEIREHCPDAKVVLGGLTSYDDVNMFETWGFLRRMLEYRSDMCGYFDVLGLHPYTFFQYDTPEYDELVDNTISKRGQTAMTEEARSILAEFGCGDKDIYYTELGWPSYDLSREQVARYAVRSMLITARDGVEGWYWYTFWDDPPEADGIRPHENHFGLFEYPGDDDSNRTPKPAWNDLVSMLGKVGQGRFALDAGKVMGLPDDVYVLAFVDDEQRISLAMWDGREQPDVSWGVESEGGPDTTYDLALELPTGTIATRLYDQHGVVIENAGDGPTLHITLDSEVKYLIINPDTDVD